MLTVRSADPARLLVSTSATLPGSAQLRLLMPDNGSSTVVLQALDSSGDVDLILSGQFVPERRVAVHLVPSAIFPAKPTEQVMQVNSTLTEQLELAPVDPRTHQRLATQTVRAGLDPQVTLVCSDETGLVPSNRTSPNLAFYFRVARLDSYTLTPSSPVFATGGSISVVKVDTRLPSPQLWMAKNARIYFPQEAMFGGHQRLISEDPSKVLMSFEYGTTPAGTIETTGHSRIYVDVSGDSGTVAVRIESDDGTVNRVVFGLTPGAAGDLADAYSGSGRRILHHHGDVRACHRSADRIHRARAVAQPLFSAVRQCQR